MIKRIFITLLILSSFILSDVNIYTVANYKPYSYRENGVLQGIEIDIIKSIFNKIKNQNINIEEVLPDDIIDKLKTREILILNNTSPNSKESDYIESYSDPFFFEDIYLYCSKNLEILKKEDLQWPYDFIELNIANDGVHTIDKLYNINIQESSDFKEGILSLINQKSDCIIGDELRFESNKLNMINDNYKIGVEFKKIKKIKKIFQKPIYIGFSKKYFPTKTYLINNINLAIRVMNDYNDTAEIVDKYRKESLSIEDKKISAVIYPWGFLVSQKIDGYGILPEIVSSAFKERNITVEYKFKNWNYANLLNKWGSECMTFPWTNEDDTGIYSYISQPLILSEVSFFYLKNNFLNGIKYNDIYDMKNYKLGGLKGAFYEKFFSNMSFDYTSFSNLEDMLIALSLKKIDIIPINEYLFKDAILKYMPHKVNDFAMNEKPMVKKANYILFSKKCKDATFFRDEFNKGFEKITNNGVFNKILEKHSMNKKDREEFESFFENMQKVEEEEAISVFDENTTDINTTDTNITKNSI